MLTAGLLQNCSSRFCFLFLAFLPNYKDVVFYFSTLWLRIQSVLGHTEMLCGQVLALRLNAAHMFHGVTPFLTSSSRDGIQPPSSANQNPFHCCFLLFVFKDLIQSHVITENPVCAVQVLLFAFQFCGCSEYNSSHTMLQYHIPRC